MRHRTGSLSTPASSQQQQHQLHQQPAFTTSLLSSPVRARHQQFAGDAGNIRRPGTPGRRNSLPPSRDDDDGDTTSTRRDSGYVTQCETEDLAGIPQGAVIHHAFRRRLSSGGVGLDQFKLSGVYECGEARKVLARTDSVTKEENSLKHGVLKEIGSGSQSGMKETGRGGGGGGGHIGRAPSPPPPRPGSASQRPKSARHNRARQARATTSTTNGTGYDDEDDIFTPYVADLTPRPKSARSSRRPDQRISADEFTSVGRDEQTRLRPKSAKHHGRAASYGGKGGLGDVDDNDGSYRATNRRQSTDSKGDTESSGSSLRPKSARHNRQRQPRLASNDEDDLDLDVLALDDTAKKADNLSNVTHHVDHNTSATSAWNTSRAPTSQSTATYGSRDDDVTKMDRQEATTVIRGRGQPLDLELDSDEEAEYRRLSEECDREERGVTEDFKAFNIGEKVAQKYRRRAVSDVTPLAHKTYDPTNIRTKYPSNTSLHTNPTVFQRNRPQMPRKLRPIFQSDRSEISKPSLNHDPFPLPETFNRHTAASPLDLIMRSPQNVHKNRTRRKLKPIKGATEKDNDEELELIYAEMKSTTPDSLRDPDANKDPYERPTCNLPARSPLRFADDSLEEEDEGSSDDSLTVQPPRLLSSLVDVENPAPEFALQRSRVGDRR